MLAHNVLAGIGCRASRDDASWVHGIPSYLQNVAEVNFPCSEGMGPAGGKKTKRELSIWEEMR